MNNFPTRRSTLATFGAACLTLLIGANAYSGPFNKTTYLRFSGPVALPGVTLPAGEYVFELANPDSHRNLVRVMNRSRDQIFLNAFTRPIVRAPGLKTGIVTLAEPAAGRPPRIVAWYPVADRLGYQFVY